MRSEGFQPSQAGSTPAQGASLSAKHARFVAEYLKDRNAKQAYIRAGYKASGNSAEVNAVRLLRNAQVAAEIAKAETALLEQVQAETGITLERTLREIARGAFHDPRHFFNADGSLKRIVDLDDEAASALAGFEVVELTAGGGEARTVLGHIKKIKQVERKGYLDMLMKHLGGYKKDNEQAPDALAVALRDFFADLHSGAGRIKHVPEA